MDCTEHAEIQADHEVKARWSYGRFVRHHIYGSELLLLKTVFQLYSLVYTLESEQKKLHEYRISRYCLCIGFLALEARDLLAKITAQVMAKILLYPYTTTPC